VSTLASNPGLSATVAAAPATDAPYPWLVADIGGTNARFGWVSAPGAPVTQVRKLAVPAFAGPAEAAMAYLGELAQLPGADHRAPRHAAFAVATAVAGDRIAFTNSHWAFSRAAVQAALGLDSLLMLNDFESLAMSLPRLGAGQLRAHGGALPLAAGTLAVVGPGTGLGVGAVVQTREGRWVALPGEGGHATLAPTDDLESALLACVRRQYAHVSAERLLSGIGLPVLHQALASVGGTPAAPLTAAQIVDHGSAGSDALCGQTLDVFCALLGGFAGNVALTLGARGGLYIGGGIVPRFVDRFFASAFRQRFEAKGRFQPYLAAIPTALITDTLAALSGAAMAIEQAVAPATTPATTPAIKAA
jgi:glucokinase